MTTQDKDDELRDSRFDAQWRKASQEEPPSSIDASILAAARREAGAGPRWSTTRAPSRARRYAPLAIAATLGAVTFGVLQLVSTDRFQPVAVQKEIVTDMPPTSAKLAQDSNAAGAKAAAEAATPPVTPQQRAAPAASAEGRHRGATAAPAPKPPGAAPATSGRPPPPTEEPHRRPLPAPEPVPEKSEITRDDRATIAQPFPSATPPAEMPTARSEPVSSASPPEAAPQAPAPAPSAVAAPAPPAAPPPLSSTPAAAAAAPRAEPSPSFAPQRSQESAARGAAPARAYAGRLAENSAPDTLQKPRAPLPVDDWIALIRRLRAEGNLTEAAKELAAFRTAHADHDKLLPPDLRDWRPPGP